MLVLRKFWFWQEDWVLGYNFMKFRHFSDISSIFSDPTSTIFWYSIDLVKELYFARFLFLAIYVNLIFLPLIVCISSSLIKLENGRNPLIQTTQNHLVFFSFWRSLYVCLFILLHSPWAHVSQVSHWILWWFLAANQGNFTTIFSNTKTKIEKVRK